MRHKGITLLAVLLIICSMSACGGAGSGGGPNAAGDAKQDTGAEVGIFSGKGAWKVEGGAMFLEENGQGLMLTEVKMPEGVDEGNQANLSIPTLFKSAITWTEDGETVSITSGENDWILRKKKDGNTDALELNGSLFSRMSDDEKKEYEEKAASAEPLPAFNTGAEEQKDGQKNEQKLAFTDTVLLEDDLIRVELAAFYENEVNWGYAGGPLMEKYITVKVKNKSGKDLLFNLQDGYIHDESVSLSMLDGSTGPAPGKTKTYSYNVYYNTQPEHTPLDSLDDLYTLDVEVSVSVRGEDRRETRISLGDLLGKNFGGTAEGAAGTAGTAGETLSGQGEGADENKAVTETDYMTVEGLYVDDSYSTSDNENTRFLYIFYSAHTKAENLSIDCKSMVITVNDTNSYKAVRSKGEVRYLRNYYNSAYLKKVNLGDNVKFVETFEIPRAELEKGRIIRISKSQIPDSDRIRLLTDDIVFCDSPEEIAKEVDPEGYEKEKWALEDADDDVVYAVKNEINGFQWDVNVDPMKYQIEFWEPNNYELRTSFNTSGGTYVVKNGYVICTNDIGGVIEIPFTYENGKVKLDTISAFDFKK